MIALAHMNPESFLEMDDGFKRSVLTRIADRHAMKLQDLNEDLARRIIARLAEATKRGGGGS